MKRLFWQFLLVVAVVLHASAQSPLASFTSQANAMLQKQFGFGVTNIPIYCTTNPAVGYSSSIHFVLQSVADAYDATTPATNPPSVFRPLFSWQGDTLLISGYTCITTDFNAQIGQGFKTLGDPTISTNDNVLGIPWVVGTKGQVPAFNEYCYSSAINVERELAFVRQPGTPRIIYTNQLYMFSISNIFGAEAWNFYQSDFTNNVTLMVSNVISIEFTNNYNFGTNIIYDIGTNSVVDGWPARGFEIPLYLNTIPLPPCYWSESTRQLVTFTNGVGFLPSDLQQTHWPVHDWTVTITNDLMYALVDNNTGHVLDFVNLGGLGSTINLNQVLSNSPPPVGMPQGLWDTSPATDEPGSPMSIGDIREIGYGEALSLKFLYSILGFGPPFGYPLSQTLFYAPSSSPTSEEQQVSPSGSWASFIQSCSWHAGCPLVHYTVGDLTDPTPRFNQEIESVSPIQLVTQVLASSMSNQVCTLGKINQDYNSGAVQEVIPNLLNTSFQLNFCGANDLPYLVWSSTNLVDWSLAGTADQPASGTFQFSETNWATHPMKFYQVELP